MKCSICKNPLTRRDYFQWEVNSKRSITYECTHEDCGTQIGNLSRTIVQITEPDNIITYYYFRYTYDGKVYKLRSYNESKPLTILQIHVQGSLDEHVVSIPRFMNLLISDDFPEKAIEFHKKLYSLVVFS